MPLPALAEAGTSSGSTATAATSPRIETTAGRAVIKAPEAATFGRARSARAKTKTSAGAMSEAPGRVSSKATGRNSVAAAAGGGSAEPLRAPPTQTASRAAHEAMASCLRTVSPE
jgi:hypothetical protein